MNRLVQSELLDELPVTDPRAIHSRRDLRRINAWMRHHVIMAKALQSVANGFVPTRITDLGAGDGNLLLRVARKMSPSWRDVKATLLDRHKNATEQTLASFAPLGWCVELVEADVFDWLSAVAALEVVVANLFLHHFDDMRLAELFHAVAARARLFVAIEPNRAPWPMFCCRLLWLIGCNSVTRHDAAISVRGGFSGNELSSLWPTNKGWQLTERRTGFFSHLFVARKVAALECADMSALSKAATCRRSPK
ncbi:MAG TPA: methyltransferase domain-containing protein [Candidatus Saccharimonadales bacterium]|nr:methyltransferase domain-containing protein [Candidatus Saccharimonadales bacterium]